MGRAAYDELVDHCEAHLALAVARLALAPADPSLSAQREPLAVNFGRHVVGHRLVAHEACG